MNIKHCIKVQISLVCTCLASVALAYHPAPVDLAIKAPPKYSSLALLSESGWPLTIKMSVDFPADQSFPAYAIQPDFPLRGKWGFIIFSDPDGCLNPPAPSWLAPPSPECDALSTPLPSDETYMEFWPDVDLPGVVDDTGNADRQADLVDSAGGRGPEFQKWNGGLCTPGTNDSDCVRMGPDTGDETVDGFGFGADDDITGLVIIAEYGVGRVFDEPDFELADPVGAVNLAGLVNSVSYTLSVLKKSKKKKDKDNDNDNDKDNDKDNDIGGKPETTITEQARIWAHVNIPAQLVRKLIQYDACTGTITPSDPDPCDGDNLWRVDGGPVEVPPNPDYDRGDAAAIDLLNATTFTLKVFLVAGQAPNRLFDQDGDGDVDAADASLAGYTLLSKQKSIRLMQLSAELCSGGGGGTFAGDLDSNSEVLVPIVCPAGPGTIGRPPR